MKINYLMLSMLLLVGSAASGAEKSEQIKEAESSIELFKDDLQCAVKLQCSPEQTKRLMWRGLKFIGIVSVLVGALKWRSFLEMLSPDVPENVFDDWKSTSVPSAPVPTVSRAVERADGGIADRNAYKSLLEGDLQTYVGGDGKAREIQTWLRGLSKRQWRDEAVGGLDDRMMCFSTNIASAEGEYLQAQASKAGDEAATLSRSAFEKLQRAYIAVKNADELYRNVKAVISREGKEEE